MDKEHLVYLFLRAITYPFSWLPYSWLHALGRGIGWVCYYLMTDYRKRALSNLSLAKDLALTPEEIVRTAKKSFQNLAINCLEYPKLAREKKLSSVICCENPEIADALYQKGQGIIFFCGHQSNWEVLFLDGTSRMRGIAIGKPIKNKRLYQWILSIRQKNGGTIIAPKNAVKEGLRALRKGVFMGIVGDQGMPDSGYAFPFLGRRAWTSTAPALLAYKTQCPIIFAATRRVKNGYRIHYSDPIWPDMTRPAEEEVVRMMNKLLTLLQESIQNSPGEWLWQHNRWKQQTPQILYKRFRKDCICVILPEEEAFFQTLQEHLPTLKKIYPLAFLSLLVPKKYENIPLIKADEIIYYSSPEEMLLKDYRFKLVFNFTKNPKVRRHYERLSAFEVIHADALKELASPHLPESMKTNWSEIFKRALCRPGSLWTNEKTPCP